jgi:hypothetical protein
VARRVNGSAQSLDERVLTDGAYESSDRSNKKLGTEQQVTRNGRATATVHTP